jgi:Kdo2-lipid IVA lauroyltransferase/acyltransferase
VTTRLPEWWGPWQRAKNTLIYGLIVTAGATVRIFPLWFLRGLGVACVSLAYPFLARERRLATAQLSQSMPELKAPGRVVYRMFLHFARLAAEWAKIEVLSTPGSRHLVFTPEIQQRVRDAISEGNGVLCVTPHLGNWELLAQAATRHGLPCTTIAKPLYDPRLTALVDRFRGRSGLVTLWRGDGALRDRLTDVLATKSLLGVLIDQDTKVAHVFVPFFGRLAATPVVPQRLAIQHKTAVMFCYAVREGARYRMHFERVPRPDTGDLEADALALTATLTALTESAVRAHPEQWVWVHKRWKTRPPNRSETGNLPPTEGSARNQRPGAF